MLVKPFKKLKIDFNNILDIQKNTIQNYQMPLKNNINVYNQQLL